MINNKTDFWYFTFILSFPAVTVTNRNKKLGAIHGGELTMRLLYRLLKLVTSSCGFKLWLLFDPHYSLPFICICARHLWQMYPNILLESNFSCQLIKRTCSRRHSYRQTGIYSYVDACVPFFALNNCTIGKFYILYDTYWFTQRCSIRVKIWYGHVSKALCFIHVLIDHHSVIFKHSSTRGYF